MVLLLSNSKLQEESGHVPSFLDLAASLPRAGLAQDVQEGL